MILFVEFPMDIVCSYNGTDNLDVTLDDNISYLIGKHFYDSGIKFNILDLNFISPKPNYHDELIRYKIEIELNGNNFDFNWILKKLKSNNFDKGLTIKSDKEEILYADQYSADIKLRRQLKKY